MGAVEKANLRNASVSLAIERPYISITYLMQARTPALRKPLFQQAHMCLLSVPDFGNGRTDRNPAKRGTVLPRCRNVGA